MAYPGNGLLIGYEYGTVGDLRFIRDTTVSGSPYMLATFAYDPGSSPRQAGPPLATDAGQRHQHHREGRPDRAAGAADRQVAR